jgi:RecA-family ATPase
LNVAAAVALGGGRKLGVDVIETGRALIINAEDDIFELHRRLGALGLHFGIDPSSFAGRIVAYNGLGSGSEPFKAVTREGGRLQKSPQVSELIRFAKGEGIDFLTIDPLVKTHEANENDNGEMNTVASVYSEIAQEIDGAVLLVHHTRKPPNADAEGFAGNADAGRGASSVRDACRIARTLFTMTSAEAKRLGVTEAERLSYARLDDAKANYSARKSSAQWFKKQSVTLPNGDDAPAMAPVDFNQSEVDAERRAKIIEALAAAEDAGKAFASTTRGKDNAAGRLPEALKIDRGVVLADLKLFEGVGDIKKFTCARGKERWAVTDQGRAWASLPEHSDEHSQSVHSTSTLDE